MKKILSIIAIMVVALFCLSFTYTASNSRHKIDVREVNVAGHKYVVVASFYEGGAMRPGGVGIVHSAGCYCNNK